jgi:tetratricopeptide (TPR) repeat protein
MNRLLPALALAALVVPAFAETARAQDDEIYLRARPDKAVHDKIVQELPKGIQLGSKQEDIPAGQIADVVYDLPREIRFKSYRAAQKSEGDYLKTRPAAERRAALALAIKNYQETRAAVAKLPGLAAAKRHLAFKEAQMRLWLAQDEADGGKLQLALEALMGFQAGKDNRAGWQIGRALLTLGRLQVELKDYAEAEKTFQTLADLGVADDLRAEARVLAAEVPRFARQVPAARARLQKLFDEHPKDGTARGLAQIAIAECLAADKRVGEATALLNKVITAAKDNRLKARAYNALGRCYLNAGPADPQNLHEARWAFLFVDLIYSQDPDEQAEALYHLGHVFRRLSEPVRARECEDMLLTDRRFLGSDFMRKALREQK